MFDLVVIGSGPGGMLPPSGSPVGRQGGRGRRQKLGGAVSTSGAYRQSPRPCSDHISLRQGSPQVRRRNREVAKKNLAGVMAHKSKYREAARRRDSRCSLKGTALRSTAGGRNVPAPRQGRGYLRRRVQRGPRDQKHSAGNQAHLEASPVPKESLHAISSDDALELDKVPERMLIIGGGVMSQRVCLHLERFWLQGRWSSVRLSSCRRSTRRFPGASCPCSSARA